MPPSTAPRRGPDRAGWTLVALTLGVGLLRLGALTAEEPWYDELFSVVLASQDLGALWLRALADQTNPPGFYLALWGWARVGGFDLAWLRLLPFVASLLTVPAVAVAARRIGLGPRGALVAAALAAGSPMMLAMGTEIRAYALVALAAALTLAAAAQRRVALTATGCAALVMLHYFGAFVVVAIAAATAARAQGERGATGPNAGSPAGSALRHALLVSLPAAVLLGAWLWGVRVAAGGSLAATNAAWIPAPGPRGILAFGSHVIGTFGTPWGASLVLLLLGGATVGAVRASRTQPGLRLALAVALVPPLLAVLASLVLGRSLWVERYLIVAFPGWWILAARLTDGLGRPRAAAAISALVGWAALSGGHAEQARVHKTSWSLVARALTAGGPATVCTNEQYVALPLRYEAARRGLPLTVLDLPDCSAGTRPGSMLLRVGTERALARPQFATAVPGPPRPMGTRLPETSLVRLRWP